MLELELTPEFEARELTVAANIGEVLPGPPGPPGPAGPGVPAGGTTGQVLRKKTGADYDTEWVDESGGSGGAVNSINGKTGTVVLGAEDVGALPDDTPIPAKTSDLTNDSGFITEDDAPSQAEFDAVAADVTGEIDRFNKSQLVPVDWAPSLTKGAYWKQSDGTSGSSNKYCRTSNGWAGFNSRVAIKLDNTAYTFGIALYDENSGYLGYVPYKTGISYLPTNAYSFGISVNRQDNANLTDEDITAIGAALSAYAITDKTLALSNCPADAKAVGDAISALSDATDEKFFREEFDIIECPWSVTSDTYPLGWRTGYFAGTTGNTVVLNSSTKYLCLPLSADEPKMNYFIRPGNYAVLNEAKYIEITPPAGYCARIRETDAQRVSVRQKGAISGDDYVGAPQRMDVVSGMSYTFEIGRFNNDDAGSYLTPEFINSIKLRFYVPKKKPLSIRNPEGYGNRFFTVTVDRPLAFGGEETGTTTAEIECVIRLPTRYRVNGDPVPLVLMCHGASGYIQASTGTWYNSYWTELCNALLSAGFALFDVNVLPTSAGTTVCGSCYGSPLAVNVAKAAYDHIVKTYNVQHRIFVHGTSMGGVLASAFVKAYPQLCLAQSSFAGRDFVQYLNYLESGSGLADTDVYAQIFGYADYAALVADEFSHAEGLVPSLSLKKYTAGAVTLPPDRETDYANWLSYYTEVVHHAKADAIGDYTAYRSVPYKSWNSWADSEALTKAEQILRKAFTQGGSAPYLCVFYESGTHTEMSYGQINDMRNQLVAWYRRWL